MRGLSYDSIVVYRFTIPRFPLLPPLQMEVMFLVALDFCLSVCLFVDIVTKKVINGLG